MRNMRISHRYWVAMIASVALLATGALAQDKRPLTLGTSTVGGTYFIYGGVIASLLNNKIPGINVSTQQTQGPNQNIILMDGKRIELGLTTMGVAKQGWDGVDWTGGKKYRNMRAVFPMFASIFNCISRKGRGITTMADLDGKSVNVGPRAGTSGTYSPLIFDALGLKVKVRNSGASDGVSQLADGLVDAFCFAAGLPIAAISEFESQHPTQFIDFTDQQIQMLTQKFPDLSESVVPKGLYPSLDRDWKSLGQWSFFIVHNDLEQDLVYQITKTVLENNKLLVQGHAAAKETLIENVGKNTFLPFHPGAARYYKERGIKIPENLL